MLHLSRRDNSPARPPTGHPVDRADGRGPGGSGGQGSEGQRIGGSGIAGPTRKGKRLRGSGSWGTCTIRILLNAHVQITHGACRKLNKCHLSVRIQIMLCGSEMCFGFKEREGELSRDRYFRLRLCMYIKSIHELVDFGLN